MPPETATAAQPPAPYRSRDALAQLEKVVLQGDLASLTPAERVAYYTRVCESLGLNPLTRPFDYIVLNGRLTLYANKDAAAQLRRIHGVHIDAVDRQKDDALGLIAVTATGHDARGRTDSAQGIVSIAGLNGEALANALMKAETKAKRRLTLSLAGLGWLDEVELETIDETGGPRVNTRAEAVRARRARPVTPVDVGEDQAGDPWMRRIHAMGAERGLDHDALHDLAVRRHGVASLTELTPFQRAQLDAEVERMPTVADTGSAEGATAEEPAAADGQPAAAPPTAARRAEAATLDCTDFTAHQLSHVREGDGWRCLACQPQPANEQPASDRRRPSGQPGSVAPAAPGSLPATITEDTDD